MATVLPATAFYAEYADGLERFLNEPSEAALRAAYELGR